MPWAPPRPCVVNGCPTLVSTPGLYRCQKHQAAYESARAAKDMRPRQYTDQRWRRLRARFLQHHPDCEHCGKPASQVDHIIPRREGGSDHWSNLRPLCSSCHSRRTARDQPGGWNARGHSPGA